MGKDSTFRQKISDSQAPRPLLTNVGVHKVKLSFFAEVRFSIWGEMRAVRPCDTALGRVVPDRLDISSPDLTWPGILGGYPGGKPQGLCLAATVELSGRVRA